MLAAMIGAVGEVGYAEVTVDQLTERAGVSTRTFYQHFESKEDCFLAVCGRGFSRFVAEVEAARESEEEWAAKVRAGIISGLRFLDEERDLARMMIVEMQNAGPSARARYGEGLARVDKLLGLEAGRRLSPEGERLPEITEEAVVGGMVRVVHERLVNEPGRGLEDLAPKLLQLALLPYLGPKRAAELAAVKTRS
jgi:AcrR family transcriptional regulator